jgi:hypothetical protein
MLECPECHAVAPPVACCETCGFTWDLPLPLGSVVLTAEQVVRVEWIVKRASLAYGDSALGDAARAVLSLLDGGGK